MLVALFPFDLKRKILIYADIFNSIGRLAEYVPLPGTQSCGWNQVWVNVDDEKDLLEEDSATNVSDVLKHKTDLLEVMYKTIEKFWLNHDPNQPPKADKVMYPSR